jgi:hypothetical protein
MREQLCQDARRAWKAIDNFLWSKEERYVLRVHLKGDPAAKNYLQSDALPEFSHASVKIFRR